MSAYTIEIPDSILKDLQTFAERNKISVPEATARAFALVAIANTAFQQHHTLGVIHKEEGQKPEVIGEITGV
jgi:hypothetical protein